MKELKHLFDFYVNSSIHVALSVYALTWITLIQFDIDYDKSVLYFVFFATITGYNFVKYFGIAEFHHRSLANWLKAIQVFSFIAFFAMAYYLWQLEKHTLLLIGVLGLITFLYAIPIVPKKIFIDDQKNLRQIAGLKIYVIALVWTFTTVILPLYNSNQNLNVDVLLTSIQRFIFIIILMLPFEIRDLNYDSLKLATIPQKIGVKNTKIIGVFLLMIFFLLEYFKDEVSNNSIMTTLVITFFTLLSVVFSSKKQSKYYSAFWVESLPVLWLIVLLILR